MLPDNVARTLTAWLAPGARILEIGAGTGRVAVALAKLGFDVVAIEPALAMLRVLRDKAEAHPVRCIAAEGIRLPVPGRFADAIVIARLLYLVAGWRSLLNEAERVVAEQGLILHEWGNGALDEDWVEVRERARSLFEEAGVPNPFHAGARSESEVDQYIGELGFGRVARVSAGAGPIMSISDLLNKIESGEVSYTWDVPKEIQETCLPSLRAWAEARFDVDNRSPMPRELAWSIFRRIS
jgi:SAM-dependent methyltransferase